MTHPLSGAVQVTGMVEVTPSRLGGSRHSYVDRLVANLMYNRYEPQPTPMAAPPPQPPTGWQGAGYGAAGGYGGALGPSRGTPRMADEPKSLPMLRPESNPAA